MSVAAGLKSGQSNRKKTLKKRISNIEVRYSIIIIFEKRLSAPTPPKRLRRPRAIPHFIVRNFLFDILRFAVPTMFHTSYWELFNPERRILIRSTSDRHPCSRRQRNDCHFYLGFPPQRSKPPLFAFIRAGIPFKGRARLL